MTDNWYKKDSRPAKVVTLLTTFRSALTLQLSAMKFFSFVTTASILVGTTFAQSIAIGAPAAGTSVSAGSQLVVEVDRPVSAVH